MYKSIFKNIILNYTYITFEYTANGGEKYVYIGNLTWNDPQFWDKNRWRQVPRYGYYKYYQSDFICKYAIDDLSMRPANENELGCNSENYNDSITSVASTSILVGSIYFDFDESSTPVPVDSLTKVLSMYETQPKKYTLLITGYADREGTSDYNMDLSLKRASYVSNQLADYVNIPIIVKGLGNTTANPSDDHRSRRVDIFLIPIP